MYLFPEWYKVQNPSFTYRKGQAIMTMQSCSSSKSSKQKKINNDETKDYISQLPDSILHHISSCPHLPLEDVIKTSVLSKRWLSVWTGVSALNLYDCARFVDTTLKLYCTGPNYEVEKLFISFKYKYSCRSYVDNWICFALQRSVEELFLHFDGGVELSNSNEHELAESILFNSSFRILDTINCRIPKHCGSVSWTSRKVLFIASALLYDDVIEKILLGSPGLESLKLKHFIVSSKLTVRSSSLTEFVADNVRGDTVTVMDISALNVYSLSLLGFIGEMRFNFIDDVSSLVEINLSFKLKIKTDGYEIHSNLSC